MQIKNNKFIKYIIYSPHLIFIVIFLSLLYIYWPIDKQEVTALIQAVGSVFALSTFSWLSQEEKKEELNNNRYAVIDLIKALIEKNNADFITLKEALENSNFERIKELKEVKLQAYSDHLKEYFIKLRTALEKIPLLKLRSSKAVSIIIIIQVELIYFIERYEKFMTVNTKDAKSYEVPAKNLLTKYSTLVNQHQELEKLFQSYSR